MKNKGDFTDEWGGGALFRLGGQRRCCSREGWGEALVSHTHTHSNHSAGNGPSICLATIVFVSAVWAAHLLIAPPD